jgi:5-methylcytosine-specific restriction enzyme subunit McrC
VNKPTIYSCAERQPVAVPISEVLSSTGALDILPDVLSKSYFEIDYRSGKLLLVAGKFVGLIPINSRVVIDVRPKLALKGLLRILNVAEEEIGSLDFFNRSYKDAPTPDDNVLSLLVRSLLKQLQQLALEGVLKLYQQRELVGPFKPRINFSKTIRQQWVRGTFTQASADCFDFTKDNALNRLIKYTIWYAGKELQLRRNNPTDLLEQLDFCFNLLETVPLDTTRRFLPACTEMARGYRLPTIRRYYADIATSCLLIVANRSVDIETSGDDVNLLSFVVNLEDVFEKYIRNVIKEQFRKQGSSFIIGNGNKESRSLLFRDNQGIPVKPDVVIHSRPQTFCVADVKYKPKIADVDRYQVISYALSYGSRTALLIMPIFDSPIGGLTRVGQVYDASGVELFEYRFKLDTNLEVEEVRLGEAVLNLTTRQ